MRRMHRVFRHLLGHLILAVSVVTLPCNCFPVTLEQALSLAKDNLPSFVATKFKASSNEALYNASLGPYVPSVDGSTSQEKIDSSFGDFDRSTYDLTMSYTLFDGGRRRANRDIAKLNFQSSKEEVARNLLELEFSLKSAFYTALARKEILEHRKLQAKDSQKDYEVAQGRHRFGVARLSEVLQASVRNEQAKFNLTQAEGDLKKSVGDLNSLTGRSLDTSYDLEGTLEFSPKIPNAERLAEMALKRPEIRQAENSVKISKSNKSLATSTFFPDISAVASYARVDGGLAGVLTDENRAIGIRATWNIFELGKFYRRRSAQFEINVSQENLQENIRRLLLDLHNAHQDFVTSFKNISVAQEQLRQAEQNYSQAFGEYKVGKGDILGLVQAESALASAREQLTTSRLNLLLSKALLERASGIDKLESLDP